MQSCVIFRLRLKRSTTWGAIVGPGKITQAWYDIGAVPTLIE
jgi:hypothetical protein